MGLGEVRLAVWRDDLCAAGHYSWLLMEIGGRFHGRGEVADGGDESVAAGGNRGGTVKRSPACTWAPGGMPIRCSSPLSGASFWATVELPTDQWPLRGAGPWTCKTAAKYRLFALPGTKPAKPGLIALPEAARRWKRKLRMPIAAFGSFVAAVPPPLGIGSLELEDGSIVKGFTCEEYAVAGRGISPPSVPGGIIWPNAVSHDPKGRREDGSLASCAPFESRSIGLLLS